MKNMAAESATEKNNFLPIFGGIVIFVLLVVIIFLSAGRKEESVSYEATLSQITQIAMKLTEVGEVVLVEPTSLPELSTPEPVVTATQTVKATESAAMPADEMVLEIDSIEFACLDNSYQSTVKDRSSFKKEYNSYQEALIEDTVISASIPVLSCLIQVSFTQPLKQDVMVSLYQNRDPEPWYEKNLIPVVGSKNTYYAIINHQYVINPPYWGIDYAIKIENRTETYWDGTLSLNRAFSGLCWEGSVPDPVTMECPQADALERDKYPGLPTLVPGGLPK